MKRIFFISLMCFLMVSVGQARPTLSKSSISDLESQMKENAQAIEKAQNEISAANGEIARRNMDILDAEAKMVALNEEIFSLRQDLDNKNQEIELTLAQLEVTKEEQEDYYRLTKERIKVMYEYGSTEYLEVLLESKTTSDFFNRLEYLNKLVRYDQDMLDTIEEVKVAIEEHEETLRIEKADLQVLEEETNQKLNEVEEIRAKKQAEIEAYENDKERLRENIKMWEDEQKELDNKIEELIRLYSDQTIYAGGNLDWPVPGYSYISSPFGPRYHPVYGYYSTHTGIDIPASYGTDIHASASGQVIFSGWGNAYGNYILIDHGTNDDGNHVITQYAHCSQLLVVQGDYIVRGDVIGKIGSTGWSTGNHLHFGVKIGGEWVDPMGKTDK